LRRSVIAEDCVPLALPVFLHQPVAEIGTGIASGTLAKTILAPCNTKTAANCFRAFRRGDVFPTSLVGEGLERRLNAALKLGMFLAFGRE
jgi:hypothetical protein